MLATLLLAVLVAAPLTTRAAHEVAVRAIV
jgi:hypothetical protein